jgi:arylsulfatase A-like enzyme
MPNLENRLRFVCCFLPAAVLAAASGCTHDRPLDVALGPHVQLPERAAVLFLVDGLDRSRLEELLAGGELPNIRDRLVARGTVVENAVTSLPSITYANLSGILTGCYPGTHGIVGNKWFDRARLRVHDYTTTKTYRDVDHDFSTPTIYEYLEGRLTVSIQCAVRRGATRIIDNWATSGINWFFAGFDEVNKLIAMRFELIARLANRVGRWPVFVNAYFPGLDEIGHRFGADSPPYRRSLENLDTQIGRILDAYERIGLLERTCFVLVADHGHVPIGPDRLFDLEAWLGERAGLRLAPTTIPGDSYEKRYVYLKQFNALLINGGSRRAHLHLASKIGWHQAPPAEQVVSVLSRGGGLWNRKAVALVAIRAARDRTLLLSSAGRGSVIRHRAPGRREPTYSLHHEQGDVLGYLANPLLRSRLPSGALTSREWLALTAGALYPDLVPQVVEMFDSPHAGQAVIFAAAGAGFLPAARGGHGSACRRDMLVPMIWRGPEIPAGGYIGYARTVDVMPTLLDFLRRPLDDSEARLVDGVSLADQLRAAEMKRP